MSFLDSVIAETAVQPGGVSGTAHVFLAAVVVAALVFTISGVRRDKLRSRYSLLWLAIVVALVPLAVFPGLLDRLSTRLGISYPPVIILSLSVAFLFLVSVHLSWEVSRADDRLRVLAEEVALLRADLEAAGHPAADRGPADAAPVGLAEPRPAGDAEPRS
ncbi:DUF2304 domain-containing protein [Aquihabitans sp. McL0605]|uniref:DUF2304 domain-containing protein n=1 Tax=Aquihabitans sp. McL0605 TaxID=3415671 RepID=UPI003CED6AD9